jgi:hypothetical protein
MAPMKRKLNLRLNFTCVTNKLINLCAKEGILCVDVCVTYLCWGFVIGYLVSPPPTFVPCILILLKFFFNSPTDAQENYLKKEF